MPKNHGGLSKKKPSGGNSRRYRSKRVHELGGEAAETTIGKTRRIGKRTRGGGEKSKLLKAETANVTDPKKGKTVKTPILDVVKNIASADYDRRGIITKGAVIKTKLGNALVKSRPGQNSVVNAVLLREEESRS
jgi:small subunit ribosomal protein S8e